MKKVILATFVMLTFASAELSDEQFRHYLEVSGEVKAYQDASKNIRYFLDTLFIKPGQFPAIDKLAKEVIKDSRLKDVYMNTFRDIPEDLYKDIISFYKTGTGKKYASTTMWLFAYEKRWSMEEIQLRYKKAVNNGLIFVKNHDIAKNIVNEFHEIDLIVNRSKRLFLYTNKALGNKIDASELNNGLLQARVFFKQIIVQLFLLQLTSFQNHDMEALYEYTKTGGGQLERKLIYKALINWLIALHEIAYNQQNKISTMQFCYLNSKVMKNKPFLCKPEWLKQDYLNTTSDENMTKR